MSRRVVVRGKGGPEVLHVVEEDAPSPGRGAVRVRVHVAGVAFGDVMRRRGVLAPPREFTPGYDVVGEVEEHGAACPEGTPAVGERVAAFMRGPGFGGYADRVCVAAVELVRVPDGVDDVTAVALGLNYITAHQLLSRIAPASAGDRVLVHGAAGGVGTALLDVGRRRGVELVGTASRGKHGILEARGCEPIDYRTQDFVEVLAGRPVDVALDGIGGAHLRRSHATLAPDGTLVGFGVSGDLSRGLVGVAAGMSHWLALKLRPDRRTVRLYNITISRGASRADVRRDWAELLALGATGALAPTVAEVVPLADVRRAHELVDGGSVIGKVVLRCAE